ncbi:MAG: hypothetical protein AAFR87_29085 [Bacteroidota bacterium]
MKYLPISIFLISLLFFTPQLKAQEFFEGTLTFEVKLKGPMAEMLNKNEPNNKMTMHVRDADYIILLSGGRYPKTFFFVADSNIEYSVDMSKREAYKFSMHGDKARASHKSEKRKPVEAIPTGKQAEVQGVLCDEYKMRKDNSMFTFYVSDDYRVNLDLYPKIPRTKASFLIKGLDGRIPLKTIKRQKDLQVVTTAVKITPQDFDPKQFQLPPGFKVKGRDYRW